MESMSANYMKRFGNKHNLTPFLDSLSQQSWFFTNAYSAGIHTNNGIFSTLYSLIFGIFALRFSLANYGSGFLFELIMVLEFLG